MWHPRCYLDKVDESYFGDATVLDYVLGGHRGVRRGLLQAHLVRCSTLSCLIPCLVDCYERENITGLLQKIMIAIIS